jgi:hypothetical protein
MLEERGLAGAWRCHDEAALAFADRAHEIDDARREPLRHRLEGNPLERADDGQFIEAREIPGKLWIVAIHLREPVELGTAVSTAGLALDPLTIAQIVATDDLRRDEDVIWMLCKAAFRVADKAKAFTGDLDDAFVDAEIFLADILAPATLDRRVVAAAISTVVAVMPVVPIIAIVPISAWAAVIPLRAFATFLPMGLEFLRSHWELLGFRSRNSKRGGLSRFLDLFRDVAWDVNGILPRTSRGCGRLLACRSRRGVLG